MPATSWSDLRRAQLRAKRPALAYAPGRNLSLWRREMSQRLIAMLGCPEINADMEITIEFERSHDTYLERRFVFRAEEGADVPCHLLLPHGAPHPLPVMICLQGHTTGMHISLGRPIHARDAASIAGDRDFALQAVRNGFAALALEIRCFGERGDTRHPSVRRTLDYDLADDNRTCKHAAMTALLLGRTLLGERVFDLRRACDALAAFPEVDPTRIYVLGHSGGGTIGWYAAAIEPRIRGLVAASCFGTLRDSIGAIDHCTDNYLFGMLDWFDFPDLAALIAPRPLIVAMGRQDHLFPLDGVLDGVKTVSAIYEMAGALDAFRLVLGPEGHRFYADLTWPVVQDLLACGAEAPAA